MGVKEKTSQVIYPLRISPLDSLSLSWSSKYCCWKPMMSCSLHLAFKINFVNCLKETVALCSSMVPNIWMKVGGRESPQQALCPRLLVACRVSECEQTGEGSEGHHPGRKAQWRGRFSQTLGKCPCHGIWVSAGPEPRGFTLFFQIQEQDKDCSCLWFREESVGYHVVLMWLCWLWFLWEP